MKKAFTMIELIFVIVIIGILASVAIPKLAATRDDAKISAEVSNFTQVLSNLGAEFVSKGDFVNYTVATANSSCDCFDITQNGTSKDGNVTVGVIGSASENCPDNVLSVVKDMSASLGNINPDGTAKTYTFAGVSVVK